MTTIEHEDMPKGMVRRICLTGGKQPLHLCVSILHITFKVLVAAKRRSK